MQVIIGFLGITLIKWFSKFQLVGNNCMEPSSDICLIQIGKELKFEITKHIQCLHIKGDFEITLIRDQKAIVCYNRQIYVRYRQEDKSK